MAYAAVVSLAQTIHIILNYHQHLISPKFRDQIISIDRYAIFLQALLDDFPDKAERLEGRIRVLMDAAEDIIESSISEQIHESRYPSLQPSKSKSKSNNQPIGKYEDLIYVLHELKRVVRGLDSIVEQVMQIKDKGGDSATAAAVAAGGGVDSSVHNDTMVGFENDVLKIKSRLCGESNNLVVIPIVGMGGIGKTTLARNLYDDRLIVEHFRVRAWVTVSQNYSVQEIVSSLLVSMKGFDATNETMKEQKLYQHLYGRRYLIVLDDMWSTTAWDDLQWMFPDGNGSRIMLTTRLSDVASYVDSSGSPYNMSLMDEDRSWDLLQQRVFKRDHSCPVEFENVGRVIARSCKGLPLAIVVMSGLLAINDTINDWNNIARDVKSAVSTDDGQFDKILSLSYTHLPHYLRPCFLYMAGFPEDYEMSVTKLIRLWAAEGFLDPDGCNHCNEQSMNKSLEETAQEYLEDLVRRSLVLVTKRKSDGRIKSFGLHDLMREMCIRKAKEENFTLHVGRPLKESTKVPRRVSIARSHLNSFQNVHSYTIRTIIYLEGGDDATGSQGSVGYFRLLRILDVVNASFFFLKTDKVFPSLPVEVFELFHLRYLAFESPFQISEAISNLRNLQTLMIIVPRDFNRRPPAFVHQLPVTIWRLTQLRHLVFFCRLPPFEGEEMLALENLQTLCVAINFVCSEKMLKMVPNLKKLGIAYTKERDYEEDYELHNLVRLQRLENLKLKRYIGFPFPERIKPAFPETLRKLTLSGLGLLPWEDMKIVGSLPNLQVLKLRNFACVGEKWETSDGEFPELKHLLIDESYLWDWITESSHFPKLKCLVLRRCSFLREIPEEIGEIATLELIEVDRLTNRSLVVSAKRIQDYQRSYENYDLQVSCV